MFARRIVISVIALASFSVIPIASSQASPKVGGSIGSKVADGDMAIQVKSVKCGLKTIGSGFTKSTAMGQFCVVTFSLSAAKKKPVNFFSSSQIGITKLGYEVEATTSLDDKYPMMLDVNPGNMAVTSVVYDIGKKDSLKYIEIHDSMFSGGILIDLTKTVAKK